MTSAAIQLPGAAATLLALAAGAIVVVLHIVRTNVDPVGDGVSAYALTAYGSLYRTQAVAAGFAALLLTMALLASGLGSGVEVVLLALFGLSRILIARYPTDPHGTSTLSRTGRIHVLLAAVAFVAVAVVAPSIAGTLAPSLSWAGSSTLLAILGWATTIFALGTFASNATPATRRFFGLVERGAYAAMLGWIAVAAAGFWGLA